MRTKSEKLERYKLAIDPFESAYSNNTVVHPTSGPGLGGRVRKIWRREKDIGIGAFGTVWLEKERSGESRAVKRVSRRAFKVDSSRELEILADLRGVSSNKVSVIRATLLMVNASAFKPLRAFYGLV